MSTLGASGLAPRPLAECSDQRFEDGETWGVRPHATPGHNQEGHRRIDQSSITATDSRPPPTNISLVAHQLVGIDKLDLDPIMRTYTQTPLGARLLGDIVHITFAQCLQPLYCTHDFHL